MVRITRWVLGHKLLVGIFWLIVTMVGFAFVQRATNALSQQFSLPGQQAYETNLKIWEAYHRTGGESPPLVLVFQLPAGGDSDDGHMVCPDYMRLGTSMPIRSSVRVNWLRTYATPAARQRFRSGCSSPRIG